MIKKEHSPSELLMTEILLAILIFSIAAAGCLRIFAGAVQLSDRAKQLKLALNSTENLIQQIKSVDGNIESIQELFPEEIIYYDKEGKNCLEEEMDYQVCFSVLPGEGKTVIEIQCLDRTGKEIYELTMDRDVGDAYGAEKEIGD